MAVNFVYNYFFERHIPVRSEWLHDVIAYIQSSVRDSLNNEALAAAVYEQWIYSEIGSSTEPALSLPESARLSKKFSFNANFVLEVNCVIDIGASLLSQFSKLTFEFEDNSGFNVADEGEKGSDNNNFNKPRRMLLMELTDGEETIKAIEYRPIRQLSLLTSPGCKVVVHGDVTCRRNVLLLTEGNCCVLGGDDEELMKTRRPVQVMAERLGKQLKQSNKSKTPTRKCTATSAVNGQNGAVRQSSNGGASQQRVALPTPSEVPRPSVSSSRTYENPVAPAPLRDARSAQQNPIDLQRQSQSIPKPVMQVKPLSDTESACMGSSQRISLSSTSSVSMATSKFRKSSIVMDRGDTPRSRNQTAPKRITQTPTQITPPASQFDAKRVKLEPCDDDIMIIDVKPSDLSTLSSPHSAVSTGTPVATPQSALNSSQRLRAEECVVERYTDAGIVSIADALNATRFALGSLRRNIVGVMRTVKSPLRIVDDLWTMSIVLTDETHNTLECIVAHSVLTRLIGLSPQEAIAIRASQDKSRRREGTLRLKSVQESMERLDIVWEVELYACGNSTPVVRDMQTLAQKFGLVR